MINETMLVFQQVLEETKKEVEGINPNDSIAFPKIKKIDEAVRYRLRCLEQANPERTVELITEAGQMTASEFIEKHPELDRDDFTVLYSVARTGKVIPKGQTTFDNIQQEFLRKSKK